VCNKELKLKPIELMLELVGADPRGASTLSAPSFLAGRDNAQGTVFSVGLVIFMAGLLAGDFAVLIGDGAKNPYGVTFFFWAILQTLGLIIMTVADVDVDLYFNQNKIRLIFLSITWIFLGALLPAYNTTDPFYLLPAIPFLYLHARFTPVTNMHSNFPCVTQLFVGGLVLHITSDGIDNIAQAQRYSLAIGGSTLSWPLQVMGVYELMCAAVLVLLYMHKKDEIEQTLTLRMNTAIYAYLFAFGTAYLMESLFIKFFYLIPLQPLQWTFAPIHLIPVLIMSRYRVRIRGKLGRRWLRERMHYTTIDNEYWLEAHQLLGNLCAVEAAIERGDDLNAFCFELHSDKYTLLILAGRNGHVDAVDRLLSIGHVNMDQASPGRAVFPLYMAAQFGHARCVAKLIAAGASLDKQTRFGETPLLVASARGHTPVVELLSEAGARIAKRAFMGLTARDSARAMNQSGVMRTLRAYESSFQGHILEERGCKCVVSWPGVYTRLWDQLVSLGKNAEISAAVSIPQSVNA
jgi:hypothetical protein